jgi:hypothetical protein
MTANAKTFTSLVGVELLIATLIVAMVAMLPTCA